MKVLKRFSIILVFGVSVLLSACSKTVQWEEEVPLNTGETIWVKRTVVYSSHGGAGNPLDMAYRPEKDQAIEFTWRGKSYHYKGEAWIMLLAISPRGQPVLVGPAENNSWEARYRYLCTIPFYVQLVPDEPGRNWTWPPQIEPWLYNLPTNLLLDIGDPSYMRSRYSQAEKMKQPFWVDPYSRYLQKVEPAFTGDLCKKKEK